LLREWIAFRSVGSIAAKLRAAFGDEGRDSFFRIIAPGGRDYRFFFSFELIRQAGFK
jgi:hypothetical protein